MTEERKQLIAECAQAIENHERYVKFFDEWIERTYKSKNYAFTPDDEYTKMLWESEAQMLSILARVKAVLQKDEEDAKRLDSGSKEA